MKLTKFRRLRNAASNLDMHFVAERILEVRTQLDGHGLPFDKRNIAITEEGIYYKYVGGSKNVRGLFLLRKGYLFYPSIISTD